MENPIWNLEMDDFGIYGIPNLRNLRVVVSGTWNIHVYPPNGPFEYDVDGENDDIFREKLVCPIFSGNPMWCWCHLCHFFVWMSRCLLGPRCFWLWREILTAMSKHKLTKSKSERFGIMQFQFPLGMLLEISWIAARSYLFSQLAIP